MYYCYKTFVGLITLFYRSYTIVQSYPIVWPTLEHKDVKKVSTRKNFNNVFSEVKEVGHDEGKHLVFVHCIVSISQQEINVCCAAFRYQLS